MPPVGDNQNNTNFNNNNNPGMSPVGTPPPPTSSDDGKTLSIIGLILAFVGMQLIGLILSIIGFSKAKKAGASKGLAIAGIILNIIGMIVASAIGIILVINASKNINNQNNTTDSSSSSTVTKEEDSDSTGSASAVTADSIYDMSKACTNNYSISNAGTYVRGSSKVVVFNNSVQSESYYGTLSVIKDSWRTNSVSEAGLIVCMEASEGTSAGKSCDYESNGEKVSIPLYHTSYQVRVIEAKTGQVLTTQNIKTNSNQCPSFTSYQKSNPKVYESPKGDMVEGVITPYAG